jgi:hypothetical protein
MHYDVFISYRREGGAPEARLIKTELERRRLKVFLDVSDLQRGHFDEVLLQRIAYAPNFLLVLSPGALDRCDAEDDWMRQEIRQALGTKRNIIPIVLPHFRFPAALPPDIAELPRHQAVEYSHTLFDATIGKIMIAINPQRGGWPWRSLAVGGAVSLAAVIALLAALNLPRSKHDDSASITAIPALPETSAVRSTVSSPTGEPNETTAGANPSSYDRDVYSVHYDYRRGDRGFRIGYRLPYLDLLRHGGPVIGQHEKNPFVAEPPRLLTTVANNTSRQIVLTSVVLDIAKSELRDDVIPTVDDDSLNSLIFVNHGWGAVINPKLVFQFGDASSAANGSSGPTELDLPTFQTSRVVQIRKYVPPEMTPSRSAHVVGELQYGPAEQRHTVKFSTDVKLSASFGAALRPSGEEYGVYFKSGQPGRVRSEEHTSELQSLS